MADVAGAMDRTQRSLGPVRSTIIAKGVIYSTGHGYPDFSVPPFAEFMRRRDWIGGTEAALRAGTDRR